MDKKKKLSCIIPIYKPDEAFYRLVKMLLLQELVPDEILLMNTDAGEKYSCSVIKSKLEKTLKGIVPGDAMKHVEINIHSVPSSEFDHGGTRRYAAQLCKGEYMLFMTQDAVPYDTLLTKHLLDALLSDETAAAAYARQLPKQNANAREKFSREFNYPNRRRVQSRETIERDGIKTYFCSNVCAMYKKSIYDELDGFVEKTIFNEDMIYARKAVDAGYKIIYEPQAAVLHSHNYSYIEQLTRNFDLAVSQRQYREVFDGVSSTGEGKRYVREALTYFGKNDMINAAADTVFDSGFRYAGYLLGKHYESLPKDAVRFLSMNKRYWTES